MRGNNSQRKGIVGKFNHARVEAYFYESVCLKQKHEARQSSAEEDPSIISIVRHRASATSRLTRPMIHESNDESDSLISGLRIAKKTPGISSMEREESLVREMEHSERQTAGFVDRALAFPDVVLGRSRDKAR